MDAPRRPFLSVILVTHNSAAHLPGFASSVHDHPPSGGWESIVVDNDSADATVSEVHRLLPHAQLIRQDSNLGFAAAVNRGVIHARGQLILLSNPDVTWSGPVIDDLADFLLVHPRAAAVVPRLTFPDGSPQPSSRRFPTHANIWFSRGSPLSSIDSESYTLPDPKNPMHIEAAAATFMLVRVEAWRAVGGMDEEYFLYVEDTDLCKRWADSGREVWMHPGVSVSHAWKGGSTRDPALYRHHAASLRRYFRIHHPRKRVRNSLLFAALQLADLWRRIRGR